MSPETPKETLQALQQFFVFERINALKAQLADLDRAITELNSGVVAGAQTQNSNTAQYAVGVGHALKGYLEAQQLLTNYIAGLYEWAKQAARPKLLGGERGKTTRNNADNG